MTMPQQYGPEWWRLWPGLWSRIPGHLRPDIREIPVSRALTLGAASVLAVPANPDRKQLILQNDDAAINIYISLGSAAALNSGIRLNFGGGSYTIDDMNMYRGDVYAIGTAGAPVLMINEVS